MAAEFAAADKGSKVTTANRDQESHTASEPEEGSDADDNASQASEESEHQQSDGNDSSITEVDNEAGDAEEREAKLNAQVTKTARKQRKKERIARRLEKEAREKVLKRAKKREEKEKREKANRYELANSSTHNININPITHREALLEPIEVYVISSDPSSSEGDEAEQLSNKLSNLKAIATVEEEILRYKYSTQVVTTNNTFPLRQEKDKAKKRKRRHPRYDYLHSKYTIDKLATWGYYKNNPRTRRTRNKSLISNNLERSNKIFFQHANISSRARAVRVQETFYVMGSTCHGRYGTSNLNLTPNNIHNYRNYKELPQKWTPGEETPASESPPTGEETSTTSPTTEAVEGEVDMGAITDASLLPTTQEPQNRESCLTASSTYFIFNPNSSEVTLNSAPTGRYPLSGICALTPN